MTVIFHVGRRIPKSWYKRLGGRVKGLMTFQENLWQIVQGSLKKAKKKADGYDGITFNLTSETESEDLHYQIEWRKVIIRSTPEMEEEEYNEILNMYTKLGKKFKKDFPMDDKLAKHFKSKLLTPMQIEDAYAKGYGAMSNNNIANKMLEMGILTHVEWNKDFDVRQEEFYM
jgi:hypothetical protein